MREGTKRYGSRIVLMALALALVASLAATAHEGHEHTARGTIQAIDATNLKLKTTDDKTLDVMITKSTKFLRGTTEVKREDVEVGERAVVGYMEMHEMLHATEVKLAEKKP